MSDAFPAPARARTMVYISNADSAEISVLELQAGDGTASLVEKIPIEGRVMPMAISPDLKYLYAAFHAKGNFVDSFAIDPGSGKLTRLGTAPLADDMTYISTDRTGKYIFGASYSGNKLSVNALAADGNVGVAPLQVLAAGKNAHCVIIDPTNRFLFVPSLGDDVIQQYLFDAGTGKITPNAPPAVQAKHGAGPRHFVFHPKGRFAYGLNELDGSVNTYMLETSGTLTLLQSDSIMPEEFKSAKPWGADLHLTPDGNFLYASERTSNTISAFRVDAKTGKIVLIGNYPTETQPRGFNIDPQGKYLLAVGQKSNGLSIYRIDPQNGILEKISHQEVGRNPNWVEIITLPEG